jgi:perosamine synthetase
VIDYAGQMADYSALQQVCDKYNLILIEDASHALPAAWRIGPNQHWQPAGSVADLACFSFYANKPITTAEGGMIVTNSKRWALLSRQLRLHGFAPRSDKAHCAKWAREVCHMGFKYNLPDVGAALGIRQFEKLDAFWQGRRRVAAAYTRHLSGCPHLKVPVELPNRQHSWHLYPVRLLAQPDESKRNRLVDELYACGIECSVHWYPLHLHQYIRNLQLFSSPFHVAEEAYRSLISLPIYPSMTDHEVEFVADSLLKALKRI